MLSKNARMVLKIAKSSEEKSVSYLGLTKQLNWDFGTVKSAGDQLVDKKLAVEKYHSPLPGSRILWGIVLTEEGRNSKKYFCATIGSFLLKSVAVPIAVSFTTAVLTTLAMQLLQR